MASCLKLDENNILDFIDSFDTVLTDCDGVLWNGTEAIEHATDSFTLLKKLNKSLFLVTNNSTKSREEYVDKCESLGFHCNKDDIVGSAYVTAQYIKEVVCYTGPIFMLGSSGLHRELTQAGYEVITLNGKNVDNNMGVNELANVELNPEVKCVVVGFDKDLSYMKLTVACRYLSHPGCIFVATNTDAGLPIGPGKFLPGTGAIVAAVSTALGREPDIIGGKPSKHMFEVVQKKQHVNPERTIMIGDRLNTDILLAHNCNLRSLHVHTGVHGLEDAERHLASTDPAQRALVPNYYLSSFGQLAALYEQAKQQQQNS